MISKTSSSHSSSEKDRHKTRIEAKTSSNETSNNTGGKPERRRRKFSPLGKDISSKLSLGSGTNQNAKSSEDMGNSENNSENESLSTKTSLSSEHAKKRSSKSDTETSSSSNNEIIQTLPQQEMQEDSDASSTVPMNSKKASSDVNVIQRDPKRKLDSKNEINDSSREIKRSRKSDLNKKNSSSYQTSKSSDVKDSSNNDNRGKGFEDQNGSSSVSEDPKLPQNETDNFSKTSISSSTAIIDQNNGHPRKQRILALLEHRRMLVRKIRQCKDMVKSELVLDKKKVKRDTIINLNIDDVGAKKDNESLHPKKGQSKRERLKKEYGNEIKDHRKMSDNVTQIAKKQRHIPVLGDIEKNRVPPLRRSSSKKFLQSNPSTDRNSNESANNSLQFRPITPNIVTSGNQIPLNISSSNKPISIQSHPNIPLSYDSSSRNLSTTTKPIPNIMNGKLPHIQNLQQDTKSHSSNAIMHKTTKTSTVPYNSHKHFHPMSKMQTIHNIYDNDHHAIIKTLNTSSAKSINFKSSNNSQNGQFSTFPYSISNPMKAKERNSNLMSEVKSPRHAEILNLRDKRKEILEKLAKLNIDRKRKRVSSDSIKNVSQHMLNAAQPQYINKNVSLQKNTSQRPPPSSIQTKRLPPHRKTHWNYLLEEMRWLATDVMEERKWKIASASTLSNVFISNKSSIMQRFYFVKQENGDKVQMRKDSIDTTYVTPTTSDLNEAKHIASMISVVILEHWDALIDGGVCVDEGFDICEKIQLLKVEQSSQPVKDASDQKQEENQPQIKVDNKCEAMTMPSEIKNDVGVQPQSLNSCFIKNGDGFNKMNKRIVDISRLASQRKSEVECPSESNIDKSCAELEKCGFSLTHSQKKAVHFIENIWNLDIPGTAKQDVDGHTWKSVHNGCGAILSGMMGSGKTIAVCSVIWKNRENGPQLVICPPGSLVST